MLSPLDDYPIHQIAQPVRYVATSDRNFYDRYYFMLHNCSGELVYIFGLGVYPNLGVMDAFASARVGDDYTVVRASKELGAFRDDMTIGPIRLEIVEPLNVLRWIVEPNEWGLEMDITWHSFTPPHLEMPRFRRDQNGRVSHDGCRFNQAGRYSGHVAAAGKQWAVEPSTWWGARDRSWGVRPVGDPEPERAAWRDPSGQPLESWYWHYAPFQFPDYALTVVIEELGDGTRTMEDAVRIPTDGSPPVHLGSPEVELEFVPGTREVRFARMTMTEPTGEPIVLKIEPLIYSPIFLGTGYRAQDHWRHGKPQGPLAVEGLHWDFSKPEDAAQIFGVRDAVARLAIGDTVGYGDFEYAVIGPNDRCGFKSATDVAV